MSFEPPAGILDIGNATLRVGKLEVTETSGLNQGLLNIVKNDLLITETTEYTTNQTWGIKLPTTWVGEFEVKGQTGKYVEFNFYNEGSTSNAQGYTLNFTDTSLTLKYDNGNNLPITGDTVDSTLSSGDAGYGVATIPTIVGTYRKVNIFFERGVIAVSIDGARVLYYKESDGFNNGLGVASRVVSTTGGAFVNAFFESDHGGNSGFKNLRIVNGRFISDKTSNVSFIGSLGVGVNSPKEALDIRGNMHFNRVSNVSQVSVDSNVVTEYTGPHDRPLRKYPEVALTADAQLSAGGYKGYIVNQSSFYEGSTAYAWKSFAGNQHWLSSGTAFDGGDDVFNDTNGPWISIQLPTKIKLEYLEFYIGSGRPGQTVAGGSVYASNDGSNWTNIGSLDNLGNYTDTAPAHVNFTHTTRYDRYLLHVTSVSVYTYAHIERLSLYGYEEGSGSLDTTLKSVYNVPATTGTQLDVYYDGQDYGPNVPTSITDKTGNGNNTTTIGSGIGFDSTYKAFTFDGTSNGKIVGTHNFGTDTSPVLTMSFWMKRTAVVGTGWNYVATIGTSTIGQMIGLTINPGSQFNFSNYNDGTLSAEPILLNQWYHVTLVANGEAAFNSTNFKLYINGKEPELSGHGGGSTTTLTGNQLTLGTNTNSGEAFNGSIANFRLYSKALNADQVKELYDYQKDYFLGSKSQVTLYKGHLGVGVTEPSGQLELAGDERIQEYPPRAFETSAGTNGPNELYIEGHGHFKAWSTSYYNPDYTAGGAFTKSNSHTYDSWISGQGDWETGTGSGNGSPTASAPTFAGYKGGHLILELPYSILLKSFIVDERLNLVRQLPSVFAIIASNDGINWDTIFNHTATAGVESDYAGNIFSVNATKTYSQYGFVALKNGNTNTNDHVAVGEWRLFGTPGPTTLDKGSLTLGRSLDVPRVSRYDVDTETPRPEKLVLDFDTTVNSSPTDISGKGNHGAFNGNAQYSTADKAFTGFPSSSSNYISGNLIGVSGAYAHTQSYWINGADTTPRAAFTVGKDINTTREFLNIWFTTSQWTLNADGATTGGVWAETIYDNRWYHVVLTYDGGASTSSYKLYINGEYKTPTTAITASTTLNLPSNPEYRIGRNNGTQWYNGMVSNPKVYSVALEPSEVKKLYNLGRTGRSMVISDTAVGIGKVPEAQLDVRGSGGFTGDLTVGGSMNNHQYWFWGNRNSQSASQVIGSTLVIQFVASAGYTSAWKNSNTWECPVDGVWMTIGSFMAYPHSNQGYFYVEVRKFTNDLTLLNSGSQLDMHTPYRDSVYQSWQFKQAHHCKKGEKLQVWYIASGTNAYMELHSHWGNINIFKIG
jgi:hypothetical protein